MALVGNEEVNLACRRRRSGVGIRQCQWM